MLESTVVWQADCDRLIWHGDEGLLLFTGGPTLSDCTQCECTGQAITSDTTCASSFGVSRYNILLFTVINRKVSDLLHIQCCGLRSRADGWWLSCIEQYPSIICNYGMYEPQKQRYVWTGLIQSFICIMRMVCLLAWWRKSTSKRWAKLSAYKVHDSELPKVIASGKMCGLEIMMMALPPVPAFLTTMTRQR